MISLCCDPDCELLTITPPDSSKHKQTHLPIHHPANSINSLLLAHKINLKLFTAANLVWLVCSQENCLPFATFRSIIILHKECELLFMFAIQDGPLTSNCCLIYRLAHFSKRIVPVIWHDKSSRVWQIIYFISLEGGISIRRMVTLAEFPSSDVQIDIHCNFWASCPSESFQHKYLLCCFSYRNHSSQIHSTIKLLSWRTKHFPLVLNLLYCTFHPQM